MIEQTKLVQCLAAELSVRHLMLATAESCTGGLIAKNCTDLAGSSAWFDRAYITYSNQSKIDMLQVDVKTLQLHGAVSKEVVEEMVKGAKIASNAKVVIAVTGIAGPTGGSHEKPVGTVWIGIAGGEKILSQKCQFDGTREQIRDETFKFSVKWLIEELRK